MSTIEKLGIIGIRSYNPDRLEHIEFFKPLTIIWGPNGAGKTTIIECLKLITSGTYPPNTQNGKTFILDPKLVGRPDVKAQIKLKFKAVNKRQVIGIRTFQLTAVKDKKAEMKTLEQVLKTRDENGDVVSINHTCTEMERQVPELLGVSRAVLENVIFCHQEESLWAFGDTSTLKGIFDELFDTTMYTKLFETLKSLHKSLSKSNRELQTKLVFYKRDFDIHIQKKMKVLKDAETLNEEVKKFEEQEKIIRFWEEKKKDLEIVETEVKNMEMEINLIKYRREEMGKEIGIIRGGLSKTFDHDNIESLQKCKDLLVKKYHDFENEIKDKSYRLATQKNLAQLKKAELESLLQSEQSDSILMADLNRTRSELAGLFQLIPESYETNDIFNERVLNVAVDANKQFEQETLSLSSQFASEEKKLDLLISSYESDIQTLKSELQRKEADFTSKKERLKENEAVLEELEKGRKERDFLGEKLGEIEETIRAYEVDLEVTNEKLKEGQNKQERLTSEMKKINETRKILSMKKEYKSLSAQLSSLTAQHSALQSQINLLLSSYPVFKSEETKEKKDRSKESVSHKQKNELNEENKEKEKKEVHNRLVIQIEDKQTSETLISNIFQKGQIAESREITNSEIKSIKSQLNKENSILKQKNEIYEENRERIREISANIAVLKKERTDFEKKMKNLEKGFAKMGAEGVLKGEGEFEGKWREIKDEIEKNEKKLIIMEYTHSDLLSYLLENSSKKQRCDFCDQPLSLGQLEKIEKNNLTQKKEKGQRHIQEIQQKLDLLKTEKEALKKKKVEFQDYAELKRKVVDYIGREEELANEKDDRVGKEEGMKEEIEKIKKNIEDLTTILDLSSKIAPLSVQIATIKVSLNSVISSLPPGYSMEIEEGEEERAEGGSIFEELDHLTADMKKNEKRKNMLISELEDFKRQKIQMEEFIKRGKEEDLKREMIKKDNDKIVKEMTEIREGTVKAIAKIKGIEGEKKGVDEQMKMLRRQVKVSEKELQKKRTLLEFLLPQYQQKLELYKAIERKKSNRKEQEELEQMKGRLQKDLRGMLEIIEEYEKFISEKQKILDEKDSHFRLIEANIKLKELEKTLIDLEEELKKKNEHLNEKKMDIEQLNQIKGKIEEEKLKYNTLKEKSKFYLENIEKDNSELKSKASQVEETYIESLINFEIKQGVIQDLDIYVKTLEQTLLKYHRTKMEEINKIIADTWRDVYDGDDIIKIEIKSDEEISTGKNSKNYNYRIVFYTKNNKELDMKGRCSMGQKVLASIVIRLALAEAFGINCGILALDEPTTNLDKGNIRKLAKELGNLIEARKGNENFQLIVITHDRDFVKMLNEYADSYYEVTKDERGNSTIGLKNIDFI